ncbi:unnamed protein product [Urochloa humidicola]
MFSSQSDKLGNVFDIVGDSTEICIENFTLKKANGFLHLVEEMFGTSDMAHISPFLNVLLITVARLLESCMWNLKSHSDKKHPHNQSNDHDNDCSKHMEVGNSANMIECHKEIHVVDHAEVCRIIAFFGFFQFYLGLSAIHLLKHQTCSPLFIGLLRILLQEVNLKAKQVHNLALVKTVL